MSLSGSIHSSLKVHQFATRACSSFGRALHSHCRGEEFESPQVHHKGGVMKSILIMVAVIIAGGIIYFFIPKNVYNGSVVGDELRCGEYTCKYGMPLRGTGLVSCLGGPDSTYEEVDASKCGRFTQPISH